jgi:hypothetical protein
MLRQTVLVMAVASNEAHLIVETVSRLMHVLVSYCGDFLRPESTTAERKQQG